MGAPVDLGLTPTHLAVAIAAIVVAMLLALAIGNGALSGLAPGPAAPSPVASAAGATPASQVTVRAGDTLWDIARRAQPTGDVRPLVDRLVAAYGARPLQPGQELTIPR